MKRPRERRVVDAAAVDRLRASLAASRTLYEVRPRDGGPAWEVSAGAAPGSSFLARIALEVSWKSAGETKKIELEGYRRVRITPEMRLF